MMGLDTNVLVRYIVQDDAKQSRVATNFIETECTIKNPAFINTIVLCELVWVLETVYDYSRHQVAMVIETILKTRQFQVERIELMWKSLYSYLNEGTDFADNYIGYLNAQQGCNTTITFDKKAARLKTFKQL